MDNSAQKQQNKQIYDSNKASAFKSNTLFASSALSSINRRVGSMANVSTSKAQYKWTVPKYDI